MLTAVVTRCAIWVARGPSSMLKKTCSHAPRLTSMRLASSRNERLNSPRRNRDLVLGFCCDDMKESSPAYAGKQSMAAIRHEYIAQAPYRLDEDGLGRIGLNKLAQS